MTPLPTYVLILEIKFLTHSREGLTKMAQRPETRQLPVSHPIPVSTVDKYANGSGRKINARTARGAHKQKNFPIPVIPAKVSKSGNGPFLHKRF